MPSTDLEQSTSKPYTTRPANASRNAGGVDDAAVDRAADGADNRAAGGATSAVGASAGSGSTGETSTGGGGRVAGVRRWVGRRGRGMIRTVRVRQVGWDAVEVSLAGGLRRRRYRLDDERASRVVKAGVLRIDVPDAGCLGRLAASCLLRGRVREIRVRIATMPTWLRGGLRPHGMARDTEVFSWRATGAGVEVRIGWRSRRELGRALSEACAAVLRPRGWEQAGGDVPALDRAGWLAGGSTWPHGVLDPSAQPSDTAAESESANGSGGTDEPTGTTSGPFTRLETTAQSFDWPVATALANPHGRRLLGAAATYRLRADQPSRVVLAAPTGEPLLAFGERGSVEHQLLASSWQKYAVVDVGEHHPEGRFLTYVLTGLAACGAVLTSRSAAVRDRLAAEGHTVVDDATQVDGPQGYQLSVAAARNAVLRADPALRHTSLGPARDGATVALPTISVLVASKRAADVAACLADLSRQTYPAFEVLVGTHGYTLDDATVAACARLPGPLRIFPMPAARTLGEILGTLTRHADGELVSKVDDDDRYGADHLTDLMVAARSSGADLVAKSARFVHLADAGKTVDRTWAVTEAYEVTPAGGTLLLSRGVLQAAGGWSTSPRHVDADLLTRVRSGGGITYRTHGLGYVYFRRSRGHTWQADPGELLQHGEVLYDGLPEAILSHER